MPQSLPLPRRAFAILCRILGGRRLNPPPNRGASCDARSPTADVHVELRATDAAADDVRG
jgi:hypothetical protein